MTERHMRLRERVVERECPVRCHLRRGELLIGAIVAEDGQRCVSVGDSGVRARVLRVERSGLFEVAQSEIQRFAAEPRVPDVTPLEVELVRLEVRGRPPDEPRVIASCTANTSDSSRAYVSDQSTAPSSGLTRCAVTLSRVPDRLTLPSRTVATPSVSATVRGSTPRLPSANEVVRPTTLSAGTLPSAPMSSS